MGQQKLMRNLMMVKPNVEPFPVIETHCQNLLELVGHCLSYDEIWHHS